MSASFYLKRGDTSPALAYALTPISIDLTGATVVFNMKNARSGAVVVDRGAAVVVTATGTPTVRYDWQPADTGAAGQYQAEFEITYADGSIETFPNTAFIPVMISSDIG